MGHMLSIPETAVFMQNGQPYTNSQYVSEVFSKQHKDVLRSINNLDCSEEFAQRNFAPGSYFDANNQARPLYNITKNGLIFLAMGFTGAQAAKFKEDYIRAFDMMETALQHPVPAIDPAQLSELIRQAVAAALPQAVSAEPRKQVMVDAADYELLKLKAEQKAGRVPFTEDEKTTMRVLRAQGKGPTEIGLKINRTADSVSDFLSREKKKVAKAS